MNDLPVTPAAKPHRSLAVAFSENADLLLSTLGLMWLVAVLNLLPFLHLESYGIHPRTVQGLFGIVFAPFLHAGFAHLLANSIPFLILGGIVLLGGRALFLRVSSFVVVAGGLGVWLCGKPYTDHLGASGLIFGYLGFVLARGYFARSLPWLAAGVAVLVLYGGLLYGVLPLHAGVSWESHLFGFLAGLAAARLSRSPARLTPVPKQHRTAAPILPPPGP